MKQIIQHLSSGETILAELPAPAIRSGQLLIKTHRTLVSLGTEKMLVDFGKAGWISKARSQPEKVKQVLEKIKSDGLKPTLDAVFRKLGEPLPLGYCNAGEVIGVGRGVSGFQIGDRVVSNGNHAEIVSVPVNLVARIPDGVSYEDAAFTVIGAIALQGIRLVNPTFGETVVVTGMGLIGLVASQLLKANGCRVIGLDFDQGKLDRAAAWGIETINVGKDDAVGGVMQLTDGVGTDAVLITASAKTNDIISQAAQMSRQKGRIVLVGVVGLDIQRSDFFAKELSFSVSCSYGPGRYNDEYEEKGFDYPIGYVRWTENRNFRAVLQALVKGQLDVNSLITERVDLEDFDQIYGEMGRGGSIASILTYPAPAAAPKRSVNVTERAFKAGSGTMGIIGAGNFTKAMILPSLKKASAPIKYISSAGGLSGTTAAQKFGVGQSITDNRIMLDDPDLDAILITTRHNSHANQVIEALEAGKHVFVEKPLALTHDDLDRIDAAYRKGDKTLTVGFNRRFSPFSQDLKKQLGDAPGPINVIATMNAGFIPQDVWVQDMEVGGGRIIGEACHLIDLISFFTGSLVESIVMNALGPNAAENSDNASILLRYQNGSQGVINYFSNGSKAYSKERIEVYSQNRTAVIDNFRKSHYHGFKGSGLSKGQDKGHAEQFKRFYHSLRDGGPAIVSYEETMNASRAAIAAVESLKQGAWIGL
ncbi:MAG: bi-domain-containing oxidoreductase [Lewinella sp.]|nr:bi-domain-containing oxidoreductase [Lewinella sp.]